MFYSSVDKCCKLLDNSFSFQVDLCAVDECDPVEGGSCGGHGQTVGHRGLRRHEESLHGKFLYTTIYTLMSLI